MSITCDKTFFLVLVQGHLSRSRLNIKVTVFEEKKKNGRCRGHWCLQTHLVETFNFLTASAFNLDLSEIFVIW